MKAISSILLFSMLLLLSFSSCTKDDELNDSRQSEYNEICEDFTGGDFDVSLEGKDWSTTCVSAVYSETISGNDEQRFLYLYAYNFDGTYFSDTDIELAFIYLIETTIDGVTSTEKVAAFYRGFYDYSQAISNPDYDVEDLVVYVSEDGSMDDFINITEVTQNTVSGNLTFKLFEEENGEEVTMSGNFTANIEE